MRVEITDIDINKPVVIVQLFNEAIIHFAHYILFIARTGLVYVVNAQTGLSCNPCDEPVQRIAYGDHIAQDVRSGMHYCMPRCAFVTRKHKKRGDILARCQY